jgi:hypothetical protein
LPSKKQQERVTALDPEGHLDQRQVYVGTLV